MTSFKQTAVGFRISDDLWNKAKLNIGKGKKYRNIDDYLRCLIEQDVKA